MRFNTCSSCEEQPDPSEQILPAAVSIHAHLARSNLTPGAIRNGTRCFNTCSSCEEQQGAGVHNFFDKRVSIHAPLARSNLPELSVVHALLCFNTCSSCEEQRKPSGVRGGLDVSIHAPLARSNPGVTYTPAGDNPFQYMLLLRGATISGAVSDSVSRFQYMLLLRGATPTGRLTKGNHHGFNTCSSCEEQPSRPSQTNHPAGFNTCSSCEEQRRRVHPLHRRPLFQYMLLLRGATQPGKSCTNIKTFQYMLLLRGAT